MTVDGREQRWLVSLNPSDEPSRTVAAVLSPHA